ncbi:MAG: nitrous oxide-stimulated promoter family protein [Bacillota bacterium]|nr:nitrous oxide-stimulated promoter family protein [Bacillota bacterium]MDW7684921.1 nitrous oxide-stimulated promoter family protein [Bacillota bacterium]
MAFSKSLEEKTVSAMIDMYCRDKHRQEQDGLCEKCSRLLAYTLERIEKCPFGEKKPVCAKCTVHCYKAEMREEIRRVMRYAGPRMLYEKPLLTLRYVYRKAFTS